MKKAIVSGANGFIGKALVSELLANGVYVIALVFGIDYNMPDHKNLMVVPFNLDNQDELHLYNTDGTDVFFHLAWQGSSGIDRSDAILQYSNIKWTIDCLHLAKRFGAKRFVGAGSLMEKEVIYDVPQRGTKPSNVSVYGTAKLSSHYMTKIIASEIGIDHLWCYLTAYGPGDNPYRFVGTTINKMLSGEKVIQFTKADQYYDFVYITDTAKALYKVGLQGIPFCPYYIGSGKPNMLRFFIEEIKNTLNATCKLDFGAYSYKGIYLPINEYDCTPLETDTNFTCEVSFREGVLKTAKWLRSLENE